MFGFVKFYDCIEQLNEEDKFMVCVSNKNMLIKRLVKNILILSPKSHFLNGSHRVSLCGSLFSPNTVLKIYAPKGTKINELMKLKKIMSIEEFNQIRCDIASHTIYPGLYWDE